jgi:hypothetical protein
MVAYHIPSQSWIYRERGFEFVVSREFLEDNSIPLYSGKNLFEKRRLEITGLMTRYQAPARFLLSSGSCLFVLVP